MYNTILNSGRNLSQYNTDHTEENRPYDTNIFRLNQVYAIMTMIFKVSYNNTSINYWIIWTLKGTEKWERHQLRCNTQNALAPCLECPCLGIQSTRVWSILFPTYIFVRIERKGHQHLTSSLYRWWDSCWGWRCRRWQPRRRTWCRPGPRETGPSLPWWGNIVNIGQSHFRTVSQ